MSGSLNRVFILGNLGRDPEIRVTQGGGKVATLNVATSESWTNKNGEREEKTEWHRLVCFGKGAEVMEKFLRKGSKALYEGRLQTRKWQNKEGQDQYTTEIMVDKFTMLDKRESDDNRGNYEEAKPRRVSDDAPFNDDIPF